MIKEKSEELRRSKKGWLFLFFMIAIFIGLKVFDLGKFSINISEEKIQKTINKKLPIIKSRAISLPVIKKDIGNIEATISELNVEVKENLIEITAQGIAKVDNKKEEDFTAFIQGELSYKRTDNSVYFNPTNVKINTNSEVFKNYLNDKIEKASSAVTGAKKIFNAFVKKTETNKDEQKALFTIADKIEKVVLDTIAKIVTDKISNLKIYTLDHNKKEKGASMILDSIELHQDFVKVNLDVANVFKTIVDYFAAFVLICIILYVGFLLLPAVFLSV